MSAQSQFHNLSSLKKATKVFFKNPDDLWKSQILILSATMYINILMEILEPESSLLQSFLH